MFYSRVAFFKFHFCAVIRIVFWALHYILITQCFTTCSITTSWRLLIKYQIIFLTVTMDQVALIEIQILRNSLPLSTGKASFSLAYMYYSGREGHYYQRHKRSSTALFVQMSNHNNSSSSKSQITSSHFHNRSSCTDLDPQILFISSPRPLFLSLAFRNHSRRENHYCKATQLLIDEDQSNIILWSPCLQILRQIHRKVELK